MPVFSESQLKTPGNTHRISGSFCFISISKNNSRRTGSRRYKWPCAKPLCQTPSFSSHPDDRAESAHPGSRRRDRKFLLLQRIVTVRNARRPNRNLRPQKQDSYKPDRMPPNPKRFPHRSLSVLLNSRHRENGISVLWRNKISAGFLFLRK